MGSDERASRPVVPGYEVHAVLGRGGFATVYRATQTSVGREVALKVLSGGAVDAHAERRFRHEVAAVAALSDHDNVVSVYDVGTTPEGQPFIAMQLVTGGSLADRVRAEGALAPEEVARIGLEVADALDAAHEAGILHRDIKPDNVLVGRRGRSLLTDFGIATLADGTQTATGVITGTLPFTAPEIFRGGRPSPETDVYALGATLYTLAAARMPFSTGEDHVAAVMWHIAHEPHPPLPPTTPGALVAVVDACLAKDSAERPTLGELRTQLAPLAAPFPATPPPATGIGADAAATVVATPTPTPDPAVTVVATPDPAATVVAAPTAAPDLATTVVESAARVPSADPPASGRSRRTPILVGLGVLVLLALAAGAALVVAGGGDEGTGGGGAASEVAVGAGPVAVAVDGTGVWVANRDDATVTRLDDDGEVLGTSPVGASPLAVAAGPLGVWVANADDGTVTRLDPETGEPGAAPAVGTDPSALAMNDTALYVWNAGDMDVNTVDPATEEYGTDTGLNAFGQSVLTVNDDAVYVATAGDDGTNILTAYSPDLSSELVSVALPGAPTGVAVADGAVWVALGGDGTVARVDPATAEVTTVTVGGDLRAVRSDGDSVWVGDIAADQVVRIDAGDGTVAERVDVGAPPDDFAVAEGVIWLPVPDRAVVRRIPI